MKFKCACAKTDVGEVLVIPPEASNKFNVGETYTVDVSKPRSKHQHNMYFRAIEVAYENWPDASIFTPMSAEHLRKFLQVKAGWGYSTSFSDPLNALKYMQLRYGEDMFAFEDDGIIYVHVSKSIAFGKMGAVAFNEFVTAVDKQLMIYGHMSIADCGLSAMTDAQ